MSPLSKVLRALVFLPVREAEEREHRICELEEQTNQARVDGSIILGRIHDKTEDLKRTYDQLLQRT